MFEGINGKFNGKVNADLYARKEAAKSEETREIKTEPETVKPETKELGDSLLDMRLYANALGFIRQTKPVNEDDAQDLKKLFELAGMGKMPSEVQYASIAGAAKTFAGNIEKISTENNAERFFNSETFNRLNKQFGI